MMRVTAEIINYRDRNTYVFVCYHTAKWLQNENFFISERFLLKIHLHNDFLKFIQSYVL